MCSLGNERLQTTVMLKIWGRWYGGSGSLGQSQRPWQGYGAWSPASWAGVWQKLDKVLGPKNWVGLRQGSSTIQESGERHSQWITEGYTVVNCTILSTDLKYFKMSSLGQEEVRGGWEWAEARLDKDQDPGRVEGVLGKCLPHRGHRSSHSTPSGGPAWPSEMFQDRKGLIERSWRQQLMFSTATFLQTCALKKKKSFKTFS